MEGEFNQISAISRNGSTTLAIAELERSGDAELRLRPPVQLPMLAPSSGGRTFPAHPGVAARDAATTAGEDAGAPNASPARYEKNTRSGFGMDIDRVLEYIAHPAIQVTPATAWVTRANAAACELVRVGAGGRRARGHRAGLRSARASRRRGALPMRRSLAGGLRGAAAADVRTTAGCLLFDLPQVELIDELRSGSGGLGVRRDRSSISAGDLRLVLGERRFGAGRTVRPPMRSFVGRTLGGDRPGRRAVAGLSGGCAATRAAGRDGDRRRPRQSASSRGSSRCPANASAPCSKTSRRLRRHRADVSGRCSSARTAIRETDEVTREEHLARQVRLCDCCW